tara:strand:- start:1719 stop:3770 length:2052 start_codon:yes stop_codon:yes gene_type:complete
MARLFQMKALNYPIIKLTICFASGILISDFIEPTFQKLTYSLSTVFFLLIAANYYCKKQSKTLWWPSLLVLILFVTLGLFVSTVQAPVFHKSHYTHKQNIKENQVIDIEFIVIKKLKPTTYNNRYYVKLTKIGSTAVSGMLLLNVSKDSTIVDFKVNNRIATSTFIKAINTPLNPYQFNYKKYLRHKGIYHQISLKNEIILIASKQNNSLTGYAEEIRDYLSGELNKQTFKPIEIAFLKALLLGQRQDISFDVYDDYTKAGAIHILAISGLHVGILLIIFRFILSPLLYFKHGKFMQTVLILFALWGFAIIAGLSASVVRAVTMFSLFVVAKGLNRQTKPLNTLAISAFLLLLIKPEFCFDVGFQLSYAAVAAIVIIKPVLDSWKTLRNPITNFFLDLLKVSIAAQIGVLPLSLFYFHQFPGLFFITNLVIIPCLMLVLGLGTVTLVLIGFKKTPEILIDVLGAVIQFMNNFVERIASKEAFLFENISFDLKALILSYLILMLIAVFYQNRTFKNAFLLGAAVICFQMTVIQIPALGKRNAFIIFHKSRQSLIGLQTKQQLEIHHTLKTIDSERIIKDYIVGASIKEQCDDDIRRLYQINDKCLLVVDSLGFYSTRSQTPQWILLRQSPKINLDRLIDSLNPELIIWDGSNYRSDQERWKLSCKTKKIPFHQTSEKGAFIVSY